MFVVSTEKAVTCIVAAIAIDGRATPLWWRVIAMAVGGSTRFSSNGAVVATIFAADRLESNRFFAVEVRAGSN